jgi:threonine/homoserine/homoserine lactone efflux protein
VDYWPWGLLALAAVVFGGVSIFAVPPLGLIGIAALAYYGWQSLTARDDDEPHS